MRNLVTILVLSAGLLGLGVQPAGAETQTILGAMFTVRNPSASGNPVRRSILVRGWEDVGTPNTVVGDPTVNGAILRLITRGPAATYDQTFDLPAGGWRETFTRHEWPVYKGFAFWNTTTGGPVRRAIIERSGFATPEGTPPPEEPHPGIFRITVRLVGRDGPIDVLPPNPGADGGMILTLGGGDAYCVAFGSTAGGTITNREDRRFTVRQATAEACPGE